VNFLHAHSDTTPSANAPMLTNPTMSGADTPPEKNVCAYGDGDGDGNAVGGVIVTVVAVSVSSSITGSGSSGGSGYDDDDGGRVERRLIGLGEEDMMVSWALLRGGSRT
jgi:hypothetical protein